MPNRYNPFTDEIDFTGSSGGGGIDINTFCKVSFGSGNGGEANVTIANFLRIDFNGLANYTLTDPGSNYKPTDIGLGYGNYYVVPSTGKYFILTTLRNTDASTEQDLGFGANLDIGGDGNGYDSVEFKWQRVPVNRNTAEHTQILNCTAGDRIIMFGYSDTGTLTCSDGSMTIFRLI